MLPLYQLMLVIIKVYLTCPGEHIREVSYYVLSMYLVHN